MSNKQRHLQIIFTFAVLTMLLSACTQSLSSAPAATPTIAAPTAGAFATPLTPVQNAMDMVEQFAKQTAIAKTAIANGGTPPAESIITTPGVVVAITATPGVVSGGTPTNAGVATASGVNPTAVPPGIRPATYTLQSGEFPYCIARRFNVDPSQLLSLNGLVNFDVYYQGQVLKIPQSGTFPGTRALIPHPANYTVGSSSETLYDIACKYGDPDPAAIASANGISVSARLTTGQQIKIP